MAINTIIIGRDCVIEYHQLLDMLMKDIVSYGDVARTHRGYSGDLDFAYETEVLDICDSMGLF